MNLTRGAIPAVSVLLPVCGSRTTTRAAVQSVLDQSLDDLELLLIARDEPAARERLGACLPTDRRIRVLPRRAPGIVAALNTGLAAARGRFVARMDDDDVAHPQRLQRQLEHLLAMPVPGLVGARVRLVDAAGGTDGVGAGSLRYAEWLNALVAPEEIRQACFVENPLPHPTWFAERALFERLGGYADGDFPEDCELVLRAWRMGVPMSKPQAVLLDWREHPARLTRTDPRYRREAFIRMKARIAASAEAGLGLDAGRGAWIVGVGRSARRWCDALLEHGVPVRGFVDLDGPRRRRRKRHRDVVDYATLRRCLGDDLLIGAVTQPAARRAVDTWCRGQGLVPGRDYLLGD